MIVSLFVCSGNISYTLWTQWRIKGDDKITLKDFLEIVKVYLVLLSYFFDDNYYYSLCVIERLQC